MKNLWSSNVYECYAALSGKALSQQKKDGIRMLLSGPNKSSKTSIAFRLAYDLADKGQNVMFVCLKSKIENDLPIFVDCTSSSTSTSSSHSLDCSQDCLPVHVDHGSFDSCYQHIILSRIHMVYVSSSAELYRLLASIHLYKTESESYHAIFIDDFADILSRQELPVHLPSLQPSTSSTSYASTYHQNNHHHHQNNNFSMPSFTSSPTSSLQSRLFCYALLENAMNMLLSKQGDSPLFPVSIFVVDDSTESHSLDIVPRFFDVKIMSTTRRSISESNDFTFEMASTGRINRRDSFQSTMTLFHSSFSVDADKITII